MKRKIIIGINVDGILRDYLNKFEDVYIKTYIYNKSIVETNDSFTEVRFLNPEEEVEKEKSIQEKIDERITKPIDSCDLLNHFKFEAGVNYLGDNVSAEEKLKEFMYELKAFNIFGQADAFKGSIDALHRLMTIGFDNKFDVLLISSLQSKAITATYSFLATNGVRAKQVVFVKEDSDKWDYCDILIDINGLAFQVKPEGKLSVKIETDSNQWDESDYTFKSLKDAVNNTEFIEKVKSL